MLLLRFLPVPDATGTEKKSDNDVPLHTDARPEAAMRARNLILEGTVGMRAYLLAITGRAAELRTPKDTQYQQ